ncbi:MAG: nucleotidyltransferase domain-containing protein [Clostridiales bacterium]|nr:nucleotidyltransferase domain-containing protein [Clostridiales bacterium]
MRFGIPQKSMKLIIYTLQQKKEIEKASIFGSRSIGNYKSGSDVDIVIYGDSILAETINQISIELNEKLPLPYYFDVIHYESLKHKDLIKHIDEYAKIFYVNGSADIS